MERISEIKKEYNSQIRLIQNNSESIFTKYLISLKLILNFQKSLLTNKRIWTNIYKYSLLLYFQLSERIIRDL